MSILALAASDQFFVGARPDLLLTENQAEPLVKTTHRGEIGSRARTGADGAHLGVQRRVPGAAAVSILPLAAGDPFFVGAPGHFPGPGNGPGLLVKTGHPGEIGIRARTGADGARIGVLCDCVKLSCRKKFEYKCPFK